MTAIATLNQPVQALTEVTEQDLINWMIRYALERKTALLAYPHARGIDEKLHAIDEILVQLGDAKAASPRKACKLMLQTEANFRFLAPTATKKIFLTWDSKISNVLTACRNFLGYQTQF